MQSVVYCSYDINRHIVESRQPQVICYTFIYVIYIPVILFSTGAAEWAGG